MAALTTGSLTIPTQLLDPWVNNIHKGSTISQLSGSTPMKFGKGEAFVFDSGEAEYVGEGANKSSNDVTKTTQTVEPFKFQKTIRFTEEVKWADEDHQLGVIQEILTQIQPALSRALDYGVIHGINPKTGAVVGAMTQKLTSASTSVELAAADAPYVSVDAAVAALLAADGVPNGIALDPKFAAKISGQRIASTGQKLYPDFTFSNETSTFESLRAATSKTVGATGVLAVDTKIRAIVGDFSAVRWGVQKAIGLELIEFGDPDGQGDLKRNNQVAFRAEVVYGWGIAEINRNFAKIVDLV
ncbi:phage major capsid protein [Paenarthrobacter sp. NPDC057355]|uniref:phage major capsid family protein n=1 Tax=Paenarthrobacter sp. NPDC057355 TaxID=3346105 RepID=UPI00362DEED5